MRMRTVVHYGPPPKNEFLIAVQVPAIDMIQVWPIADLIRGDQLVRLAVIRNELENTYDYPRH